MRGLSLHYMLLLLMLMDVLRGDLSLSGMHMLLLARLSLLTLAAALIALNGIKLFKHIDKHALLILNVSFVCVPDKVHIKTAVGRTHTFSLSVL